jgi:hypothetical protein
MFEVRHAASSSLLRHVSDWFLVTMICMHEFYGHSDEEGHGLVMISRDVGVHAMQMDENVRA